MLLVILALFWIALLAPIAVRRFRDNGTEKSIDSFHAEHEVLSRQEYAYAPAHRLDEADSVPYGNAEAPRRARLQVVHADDTYRTLETRDSWDEWRDNYDYDRDDEVSNRRVPTNRYAAAYSSVPTAITRDYREPPLRRRTMKAQRRVILTRLLLIVATTTVLGFFTGVSLVVDLAILTWLALAAYVSLGLYAVSQGYLLETSLGIRLARQRKLATIEPLYGHRDVEYETAEPSEFYDPQSVGQWRRESLSRYASG